MQRESHSPHYSSDGHETKTHSNDNSNNNNGSSNSSQQNAEENFYTGLDERAVQKLKVLVRDFSDHVSKLSTISVENQDGTMRDGFAEEFSVCYFFFTVEKFDILSIL